VGGSRPISLSCKFYGHRCASAITAPDPSSADYLAIALVPIVENNQWVALKLIYNKGNPALPLVREK
jgi:hypothetical protein